MGRNHPDRRRLPLRRLQVRQQVDDHSRRQPGGLPRPCDAPVPGGPPRGLPGGGDRARHRRQLPDTGHGDRRQPAAARDRPAGRQRPGRRISHSEPRSRLSCRARSGRRHGPRRRGRRRAQRRPRGRHRDRGRRRRHDHRRPGNDVAGGGAGDDRVVGGDGARRARRRRGRRPPRGRATATTSCSVARAPTPCSAAPATTRPTTTSPTTTRPATASTWPLAAMDRPLVIAGAGIAGLALAAGLQRSDTDAVPPARRAAGARQRRWRDHVVAQRDGRPRGDRRRRRRTTRRAPALRGHHPRSPRPGAALLRPRAVGRGARRPARGGPSWRPDRDPAQSDQGGQCPARDRRPRLPARPRRRRGAHRRRPDRRPPRSSGPTATAPRSRGRCTPGCARRTPATPPGAASPTSAGWSRSSCGGRTRSSASFR